MNPDEREISKNPIADSSNRWIGRALEKPPINPFTPRKVGEWPGESIEQVVHNMNRDLGPIPDDKYKINE